MFSIIINNNYYYYYLSVIRISQTWMQALSFGPESNKVIIDKTKKNFVTKFRTKIKQTEIKEHVQ